MPDGRNVPQPQGFWGEQGIDQSAVLAEDRAADQPALAGSRTRQPQQWSERRQHPKGGATCRDRRRQKGSGTEVWPTPGDGPISGADVVSPSDGWVSESRSETAGSGSAGRDVGGVHAPSDDLRSAATAA